MKLIKTLKNTLFKQREINIETNFIKLHVKFILYVPLLIILVTFLSSVIGFLTATLIYR